MSILPPKRILACIRCSERRIKCNRLSPCTHCIKRNAICEYRLRKAYATRSGIRLAPNQGSAECAQSSIVGGTSTLVDLTPVQATSTPDGESAVVEIEDGNPAKAQTTSKSRGGTVVVELEHGRPTKAQITVFEPQLLQSQEGTKLIDNSLWSRIAEEIPTETNNATTQSAGVESTRKDVQDDFSYVLGLGYSDVLKQHPSPVHIRLLWQTFVERVDPMVKILHIPSFQTALEKTIGALDRIPKSFEAIMFSIYSMAILSMMEDECMKSFGESRKMLLAFYIGATKTALLQANFMSSTSLVVLQALTLHIFSIRQDYEPRAVWILTGLALRIAQVIGLFIDGSLLRLSPFETEMRRRLWWHLKHHDSRAAEMCGQAKFQQFDLDDKTPKIPTNINDSDLYPSMTQIPVGSIRPTEMLWTIVIADLSSFASSHKRKLKEVKISIDSGLRSEEYSALDDIRGKDTASEKIEELIETKYLRFCDPSKPLQLLTLIASRCATDFIRFVAHHPRRWTQQSNVDPEERRTVWNLCIQILDRMMMMQTMSRLQQFAWIVPYVMQWSVIIHILDTLRMEPLHQEADRAWSLIDTLYELNAGVLLGMDRPMYMAIGNLCLKAYLARMDVVSLTAHSQPVPGYIVELQQKYHKTKADGGNSAANSITEDHPAKEASTTPHTTINNNIETVADLGALPDPISMGDDAFWLELGGDTNMMGSDLDMHGFMADNSWTDISKDSAWDWTQWDTLMSVGKPS